MRHFNPAPKTLTLEEQTRLLLETSRSLRDYRDHMLFALALGTGLRVSEIVALNVKDVRNGKGVRGIIPLRPETTKGNKGGDIVLPEKLRRKVVRFLKWKQEKGEDTTAQAPLFSSRGGGRSRTTTGARLSKRAVQAAFKAWQTRLGFDRICTFHQLRHTYCTNLWKSTGDIRLVQSAARHSSPVVTAIYAVPSTEDLLRSVQDIPC